jgi:hypothetical protein
MGVRSCRLVTRGPSSMSPTLRLTGGICAVPSGTQAAVPQGEGLGPGSAERQLRPARRSRVRASGLPGAPCPSMTMARPSRSGRHCAPTTAQDSNGRALLSNRSVLGFRKQQRADHERHDGDDDRIAQSVIDVARQCHKGKGNGWQEAAEPAVADVIGQGQ